MTDPDWNALELRTTRGPRTLELRLLHGDVEQARMKVARREPEGFAPLEDPAGPDWCLELLREAASEWARLDTTRRETNP